MDDHGRERFVQLVAASAATIALAGLFSGFRERAAPTHTYARATFRVPAGRAPSYADERERHHPNRLRHAANLVTMSAQRPGVLDPVPPTDSAQRANALARRSERRAYDGAPPTIPHPVAQLTFPACLTCHRDGMDVAGRVAPAMPHREFDNCLQCHVVSERPMPGAAVPEGPPIDNSFVGLLPPLFGERASSVAPPTIPHATLLRSECASCHGVLSSGLRSTHPWRQSCTQCHAPSAELDQRPWAREAPTP